MVAEAQGRGNLDPTQIWGNTPRDDPWTTGKVKVNHDSPWARRMRGGPPRKYQQSQASRFRKRGGGVGNRAKPKLSEKKPPKEVEEKSFDELDKIETNSGKDNKVNKLDNVYDDDVRSDWSANGRRQNGSQANDEDILLNT